MSETNGGPTIQPIRIVIEYDHLSGNFNLSCNMKDEVITTGMLYRALEAFKTEYRLAEMREMKRKAENEIVTVPAGLKVQ